jgi:hypothetical protein
VASIIITCARPSRLSEAWLMPVSLLSSSLRMFGSAPPRPARCRTCPRNHVTSGQHDIMTSRHHASTRSRDHTTTR